MLPPPFPRQAQEQIFFRRPPLLPFCPSAHRSDGADVARRAIRRGWSSRLRPTHSAGHQAARPRRFDLREPVHPRRQPPTTRSTRSARSVPGRTGTSPGSGGRMKAICCVALILAAATCRRPRLAPRILHALCPAIPAAPGTQDLLLPSHRCSDLREMPLRRVDRGIPGLCAL